MVYSEESYSKPSKSLWTMRGKPNALWRVWCVMEYDTMPISEIVDKKLGVIDLAAAVLAMENKMPMMLFGLNDTNSIEKAVTGGFTGTTVTVE